jgi:1,4-alpha-glucan branching enzyme
MKLIKLHIALLLFALVSLSVFAQNKTFKGYTIENDTVTFRFDVRDYSKFTKEHTGQRLEFGDFNIAHVSVSGAFNNWSREGWKMTKINNYIYELKKCIADFNDAFSWEFKYVINDAYWAEPTKKDGNISKAIKNGRRLGVYNLKMYTAYPSKNGNATFKLKGFKDAKKVVLAGSFNKWNEQLFEMNKTDYGWELTLQMKPDVYQYRFIVDGKWMEDPHNPSKTPNEFNEFNSVLNIQKHITFALVGYPNAKEVILAGSFNNWNEHAIKMEKTKDGWVYSLPLSGGKHHYKFIIDGEWITDPDNPVREYDGDGHINSVYMVK